MKHTGENTRQKQRLLAFGAVILVVCLIVSFAAGAAGSYLVLSLYPLVSLGKTEPSVPETVLVPELSETQTAEARTEAPSETTAVQPETTPPQETTEAERETTTLPPAHIEPSTQAPPVTEAVPVTQIPPVTEPVPVTQAPPVTEAPPVTQAPVPAKKTKGQIYSQAVNSIVGVEALSEHRYIGLFGYTYTRRFSSSGSGFFVTENGYIVTNYHVIEGAYEVNVTTYDGTEYPAEIAGYEKANDIAVLKVSGAFTPVELGDSSSLTVGDDVLVIGNALGELSYTVTDGVVSYLNRAVTTESGAVINMFQTNAAINQGNSGGPVYDMDGRVVGIASAKYASSTVEGLGFCIPVNDAITIVNNIIP